MEVVGLKLLTGEEIIGELVVATGQGYKIKNPLAVRFVRNADGAPAMAFAQYSLIAAEDEVIEFFDHALVSKPIKLMPEVASSYISNVTGILVPPEPSGRLLQG